jgi:hypothetical protein
MTPEEAKKEYFRQYRLKNKERIYELQKAWVSKNRDRLNKYYRDWHKQEENINKHKEYQDRYWQKKASQLDCV